MHTAYGACVRRGVASLLASDLPVGWVDYILLCQYFQRDLDSLSSFSLQFDQSEYVVMCFLN